MNIFEEVRLIFFSPSFLCWWHFLKKDYLAAVWINSCGYTCVLVVGLEHKTAQFLVFGLWYRLSGLRALYISSLSSLHSQYKRYILLYSVLHGFNEAWFIFVDKLWASSQDLLQLWYLIFELMEKRWLHAVFQKQPYLYAWTLYLKGSLVYKEQYNHLHDW